MIALERFEQLVHNDNERIEIAIDTEISKWIMLRLPLPVYVQRMDSWDRPSLLFVMNQYTLNGWTVTEEPRPGTQPRDSQYLIVLNRQPSSRLSE